MKFASEEGLLSKHELEHLKINDNNIPTFYIIPKVHKSLREPPGRPIVSAIRGPLEWVGKYLDGMLKSMVVDLQSYVKDTRYVLASITKIKLEEDILLVGIDVESLYTSIPHEWGIKAVDYFLEKHYPHCGAPK